MSDAKNQAKAQVAAIVELVQYLHWDWDGLTDGEIPEGCEYSSREEVEEAISDKPLSVEMRSGWYSVGEESEPSEFRILLCWGGPSVEIRGKIDSYGNPEDPRILYAEWGERGEYALSEEEHEAVAEFCNHFYFGQ